MKSTNLKGKIYGIGLSKTGTTSLYQFLTSAGFNTATYSHFNRYFRHSGFLNPREQRHFWDKYDAFTDLPGSNWFPLIDEIYPGTKFIYTTRNIENWLLSCENYFADLRRGKFYRFTQIMTYGTATFDKVLFRSAYERHHAYVCHYFRDRPADLHVINIDEEIDLDSLRNFLEIESDINVFPKVKPGYTWKR